MGYCLRDLGRARTCWGSRGVGLVGLGMFFPPPPPPPLQKKQTRSS